MFKAIVFLVGLLAGAHSVWANADLSIYLDILLMSPDLTTIKVNASTVKLQDVKDSPRYTGLVNVPTQDSGFLYIWKDTPTQNLTIPDGYVTLYNFDRYGKIFSILKDEDLRLTNLALLYSTQGEVDVLYARKLATKDNCVIPGDLGTYLENVVQAIENNTFSFANEAAVLGGDPSVDLSELDSSAANLPRRAYLRVYLTPSDSHSSNTTRIRLSSEVILAIVISAILLCVLAMTLFGLLVLRKRRRLRRLALQQQLLGLNSPPEPAVPQYRPPSPMRRARFDDTISTLSSFG
ncbi:hypothetical protein H4R33_004874 [Dimargaris cristalligena]|uniref:Uncharacterized protein n=1 Tax=Dimargaris cristalligena TaxID=215637 RepID=A0A4P9ZX28_9FUNG|nr:hypothetical protein H4R33_004874 [Dimargaris cristalligena]RKP38187.1 hypothetical protein BJ085DRAFT_39359 [Dimargaris cristalligena]|eukprot:RKP38187.1 hypothetical protein BJ085DRAFT_39359 [Dimargaris cristalligena]